MQFPLFNVVLMYHANKTKRRTKTSSGVLFELQQQTVPALVMAGASYN